MDEIGRNVCALRRVSTYDYHGTGTRAFPIGTLGRGHFLFYTIRWAAHNNDIRLSLERVKINHGVVGVNV